MTFLKNCLSRLSAIWVIYHYVSKVNIVLKNYPGVENEIRLRAWLLDNLAVLSGMAANTTNPIDDLVVLYTLRIIQNDTAWKILFGLINMTNDLRGTLSISKQDSIENPNTADHRNAIFEGAECPKNAAETQSGVIRSLCEIDRALQKENPSPLSQEIAQNPLLVISAVGLIFQIIQFLRNR